MHPGPATFARPFYQCTAHATLAQGMAPHLLAGVPAPALTVYPRLPAGIGTEAWHVPKPRGAWDGPASCPAPGRGSLLHSHIFLSEGQAFAPSVRHVRDTGALTGRDLEIL